MEMTKQMVQNFNNYLGELDTKLRLECREGNYVLLVDIVTVDKFVSNDSVLNLEDSFYETLEQFFMKEYQITPTYNNTKTTFWYID